VLLAALIAAAVLTWPAPAWTAGTALQPHRAIYHLSLGPAERESDVVAADGRMFYRFAAGCDGWTVENRTVLSLTYETGSDVNTVWTFSSWESLDGLRFRFVGRYEQNGETVERMEGGASLERPGGGGSAVFTRPKDEVVALPQGTKFPTDHVRALIAAAEDGRKTLAQVVFDGASLENPYLVHAVIAPLAPAAKVALAEAAGLEVVPSWRARMAYFPYLGSESLPEFEIGAHYRADGIADPIVQYFDTFALDVQLHELEVLPRPEC
jgi:hypothetical protein